ncbi:TIGR00341 family protein [Aliifodinibius salicampi]|uniref:TIGR00341 family protein n=1 Tax=Fodinibius salicampi TaxID=1920655 RepID=A0ABT3PXS0_9BACT|nr:TIGR00341 family protein [Fodinibius salicampi]MCW9712660.1 TIGR00341 family protein [Fodinibius salicampi]
MTYRLLELMGSPETIKEAHDIAEEENVLGVWTDNLDKDEAVMRALVDAERTESLSDALTNRFGNEEGFRIMLFSVEATLPKPEENEDEASEDSEEEQYIGRISREELYSNISNSGEPDAVYIAMVVLSTLVAGVGLILNDVATIIGAMVIAPLLAPNVSMALAATLGDLELGWEALKANAVGLLTSLVISVLMGMMFAVNPETEQIMTRTMVDLKHIIIALAAGSAGVLAFTRGVSAAIVGVMVAVALLPPLVNVGLMLGAGYTTLALGSGILTLTNLICINLAAILTFLVQGVRPRSWWEAKNAKKAQRIAIGIWFGLLLILAAIIWYWGEFIGPDLFS